MSNNKDLLTYLITEAASNVHIHRSIAGDGQPKLANEIAEYHLD